MARKTLRRGEGSVTPYTLADGTQRWRARWWEDGRQKSASKDTEEEAYKLLIENSTDKRLGRYVPANMLTVKEAVSRFLNRNAEQWSTNTLATYRQIARSHINTHIGNVRLGALTTSRTQDWIDKLKRQGLSASVIDRARVILNGTCGELVRMDELPRNPVTGVKVPTPKRAEKVIWDESQIGKVLVTAKKMYPQMAMFYRVALMTAMRPGEIRALMWKDIDFDKGRILCRRTVTRDENFVQIVGTETKTHKARTITAPKALIDELKAYRQAQRLERMEAATWENTDLLFTRSDGRLLPQQTLRKRHKAICSAAAVPLCRFHDLRHCAASLLLNRGVPAKVVSDLLGHSSISITLDIYGHVDEGTMRAATDMLGDIAR